MTHHTDDRELATLQRRAYGPAADIHLDPAALRRLRELEAGVASSTRGTPLEEEAPAAGSERGDEAPDSDEPDAPGAVDGRGSEDEPGAEASGGAAAPAASTARRMGRGIAALTVAAACLAAAAGLAAGALLVHHGARDVGRRVAVLDLDPDYTVPEGVSGFWADRAGPGPVRKFASFDGLRTVVGPSPLTDIDGKASDNVCAFVYAENAITQTTSDDGTTGTEVTGAFFNGCSAGKFPAAVQFQIDGTTPRAMRDAFPKGASLQFVYDAAHRRVEVYESR